jgi:hypothetical protein
VGSINHTPPRFVVQNGQRETKNINETRWQDRMSLSILH